MSSTTNGILAPARQPRPRAFGDGPVRTRKSPPVKQPPDDKRQHARKIVKVLQTAYPDVSCALQHVNAWQLVAATILSAQCTDERVNMVTPALFEKYPTPDALAHARTKDVEKLIQSTGFFRNKAKSLIGMARGPRGHSMGAQPHE